MSEHYANSLPFQEDSLARQWSQLSLASWLALGTQLVASLALNIILNQGLETNPDMADRMAFLANKTVLWTSGWLVAQVGSLSLLYFYATFAWAHGATNKSLEYLLKLMLMLAAAATAIELSATTIEMGVLPELARLSLPDTVHGSTLASQLFLVIHRGSAILSGYLATGLLAISALVFAWLTRHTYSLWIWLSGVITAISGIAFSIACLTNSLTAMLWFNVVLEPCSLVWLAGVAIAAGNQAHMLATVK